MTTSRAVHKSKILQKKFGIIGKVASKYILAGFHVNIVPRKGLSFIAVRGNERFGILVINSLKEIENKVKQIISETEKLNLKPILVIYGNYGPLNKDLKKKIEELGVKIKLFKP